MMYVKTSLYMRTIAIALVIALMIPLMLITGVSAAFDRDAYTNLALTASVSSSTYHDSKYAPTVVNDGIWAATNDHRWAANTLDSYLLFTWDEYQYFDTLVIHEFKASWLAYRTVEFYIYISDDGSDFGEPICSGGSIGAYKEIYLDSAVYTKYLKIRFISNDANETNGVNICEVGVYSTMTPPPQTPEIDEDNTDMSFLDSTNIAPSSVATASSDEGASYAPSKAIDGTFDVASNNRWAPKDGTESQWFMLQWADEVSFNVIRMGEPSGIGDPRADGYTVYASNDGKLFVPLYSGNGIGTEKIIRFASPVTAKYLKIEFTSFLHETKRPNLSEIEVYNTYGGTRLLGFSVSGSSSYINLESATINLLLDPTASLVLTPEVKVPEGSTYSPVGAQDFSGDVVYTVTDAYGASREYTVKVSYYVTDSDLIENSGAVVLEWGALPNPAQYKYHKDELAAFCHFGMNTMTAKEWGDGTESPSDFTLTEPIDADSYVKLLKDAGFSRVILTVKHHDGFCLWDSAYTTHDIAETGYEGDIVAEFSAACTKHDMPMGIYISPWDRYQTLYGCYGYTDLEGNALNISKSTWLSMDDSQKMKQYYGDNGEYFTDYNDYFAAQLIELLSNPNYGNNGYICEVWFDGAKGEGTPSQHYDTARFDEIVYSYEPGCIIQGGIHSNPEMTTAGNETGRVNDEHWSKSGTGGTNVEEYNKASCGNKYGEKWIIKEADGMMTHGWFWGEDGTKTKNNPKELTYLRDVYRYSVGRGTTLLLNVPMNKYGTLDTALAERLAEWGENVKASYIDGNLLTADNATIYVDSVYENAAEYGPAALTDGDDSTYWASASKNAEILIKLDNETIFDAVIIEEAIQLGQRIEAFEIYYKNDLGEWIEFFHGKTVNSKRIAQSQPVRSSEIKIALHGLTDSDGTGICPVVSAVGIYKTTEAFELAPAAPLEISEIDNTSEAFAYVGFENVADKNATGFSYSKGTAGASFKATFSGTFARLAGQLHPDSSVRISLDGGEYQNVSSGAAYTLANSPIFETGDLDGSEHTISLEVLSGTVRIDTLYVLDNNGAGFVEFEKAVVSTPENGEVNIKLIRCGGSLGELALNVSLSDEYDLSYGNESYYVVFESGETEKNITFNIDRNTEKTGTRSLSLEIEEAEIAGFVSTVRVDVLDTESYENSLISVEKIKEPTKKTYSVGESFSADGMVIEGTFPTNPLWHILYEGNGINAAENAIVYSGNVKYRRDTLSEPVFAGALRLNILGLQVIDVFTKPNIREIEVYNGSDETNLALNATATVRSETTWSESSQHKINDGNRASSWQGAWASDYPQWGLLTWNSPVSFDTVDIYEPYSSSSPTKIVGDFYVDALIYEKEHFSINDGYTVSPAVFTKAGEQDVTLSFANGSSLTVTVNVEGIVLENKEITLKTNEIFTLVASYYPSGAALENVNWSSSNSTVATVEDGVVTPHKVGETVITVSDGTSSAECKVKVISEYEQYYDSSISFEGFSIRTENYNGVRSVFSFNNAKKAQMEKDGFTLVEYGIIFASEANSEKYGTGLTKNENGEYVTANDSIVKVPVEKGGKLVGKILTNSDVNGKIYFAGAIVNYTDNYSTGVYMGAYSVYRDALGNEFVGYAFCENEDYKYIDLYGITLDMYVNGAVNASNTDEELIWNYLNSGAVTLTSGSGYTLASGVTDLDGNAFGSSFTFKDVPIVSQTNNEKNLEFAKTDVHYTLLHDYSTGEYIAVYRGEGTVPIVSRWTHGANSQLSSAFGTLNSLLSTVSTARPQPTLTSAESAKIKTVIIDSGITKLESSPFSSHNALVKLVYPSSLTTIDGTFLQSHTNVTTVYPALENGVYTSHEEGLVDLSRIETLTTSYAFNTASAIRKLHLPSSITNLGKQFATKASSLEKIWCGDNAEPAANTADFSNTKITSIGNDAFASCYKISNIILPTTVKTVSNATAFDSCGKDVSSGSVTLTITTPGKVTAIANHVTDKSWISYVIK